LPQSSTEKISTVFFFDTIFFVVNKWVINLLIAENKQKQRFLAASSATSKNEEFFCPACKQKVILKKGSIKIPHFAHYYQCPLNIEGETLEHLLGKLGLQQAFSQANFKNKLEVYLKKLHQRPDLLVLIGPKQFLAVEFQCAFLDLKLFEKRTASYLKNGLKCWWILGKKYFPGKKLSQKTAKFLRWNENLGFYLTYYFVKQKCFVLLYQIRQPDFLNIQYCYFKTGNLEELMNFMKKKTIIQRRSSQLERQKRNFIKACSFCQGELFAEQLYWYQKGFIFRKIGLEILPYSLDYPLFAGKQIIWQSKLLRQRLFSPPKTEAFDADAVQLYCLPLIKKRDFLFQTSRQYFCQQIKQLSFDKFRL
jgi:competence protein CoiA